jgi:polysaccharide export outer membrane protein
MPNYMRQWPVLLLMIACSPICAQTPQQTPAPAAAQQLPDLGGQLAQLRPNYVLRAGDQILIRANEMDEISERPFRIDGDGFIDLPVLGRTQAAGLSVEKLEAALVELLKKYVKVPQVTITVVQFSAEPVFTVGAFKAPGIYPLSGGRTLVEMMSSTGGLLPNASRRIKVTRRKEYGAIPLPNSVSLPDGSGTSVEISMASLQNSVNPAEDIVLKPFDVISVERAELIYVIGEVGRQGGLELEERSSLSVIQAIAMAGGLTLAANIKSTMILRPIMDTSRRAEIPLDLQAILKGRASDRPLLANDVLIVSRSKRISARDLLYILPAALSVTSLAVTLAR